MSEMSMIKLFLHNLCDIAGVPAIPDPRSVLDYFSDVFNTFADKHAPYKSLMVGMGIFDGSGGATKNLTSS